MFLFTSELVTLFNEQQLRLERLPGVISFKGTAVTERIKGGCCSTNKAPLLYLILV